MARLLFLGDLHAGKGADLGRVPGERLGEQQQAFADALAVARGRECNAVVTLGDLWDKRNPSADEVMAVVAPLRDHLDQGGCDVVGIPGNHEVSSAGGGTMPAAVGLTGLIEIHSKPGVRVVDDVAVCMLPWTPLGRLVAAQDGGDRDETFRLAADLLVEVATSMYIESRAARRVLALHWSVSDTVLPSGLSVSDLREVVLPMGDLLGIGYDAIVGAHIHRPGLYGDRFAYVGPPLPLDFGAHQGDHGCWIVDTDADQLFEFVALPSRRFVTLGTGGAYTGVAGAFVKFRATMSEDEYRRFNHDAARAELEAAGAYSVTFDVTVERARRDRGAVLDDAMTPADQLAAYLAAQGINGTKGAAMLERAGRYLEGAAS